MYKENCKKKYCYCPTFYVPTIRSRQLIRNGSWSSFFKDIISQFFVERKYCTNYSFPLYTTFSFHFYISKRIFVSLKRLQCQLQGIGGFRKKLFDILLQFSDVFDSTKGLSNFICWLNSLINPNISMPGSEINETCFLNKWSQMALFRLISTIGKTLNSWIIPWIMVILLHSQITRSKCSNRPL